MRNNHIFIAKKHHCFYAQQFVFVTIIQLLIVFQHFQDTSIYVVTDPVAEEVECGECLCETKRMRDWMKRYGCYIVLL